MFFCNRVILFTGWGGLPQCILGYHPPPRADTPRPGTPPDQAPPPPDQRRLLLRTVRILLECILVLTDIYISPLVGPLIPRRKSALIHSKHSSNQHVSRLICWGSSAKVVLLLLKYVYNAWCIAMIFECHIWVPLNIEVNPVGTT